MGYTGRQRNRQQNGHSDDIGDEIMNKVKMEVVYKDGDEVKVEKFQERISGFEIDKRFRGRIVSVRYK